MLMLRRSLLSVLAGAAVLTAVATGPATASSSAPARPSLVHQTPKVPVIVDGVRYAPKQIHRFDGRPLYTRTAKNGKALIAYTKLADFRSYLRKQGLRLPTPTNLTPRKAKAKASRAGHHLKVCVDNFLMGDCYSIPSGWGIANFDSIADCDWFGHCWQFANTISSVHAVGQNAVLFDLPDFNPGGSASTSWRPTGRTIWPPSLGSTTRSSRPSCSGRSSSVDRTRQQGPGSRRALDRADAPVRPTPLPASPSSRCSIGVPAASPRR